MVVKVKTINDGNGADASKVVTGSLTRNKSQIVPYLEED